MYTELKCIIPVDKRDRTVITQDMLGEYTVDEAFFKEFERVRQVAAPPAQRPQNARQARGPPTCGSKGSALRLSIHTPERTALHASVTRRNKFVRGPFNWA